MFDHPPTGTRIWTLRSKFADRTLLNPCPSQIEESVSRPSRDVSRERPGGARSRRTRAQRVPPRKLASVAEAVRLAAVDCSGHIDRMASSGMQAQPAFASRLLLSTASRLQPRRALTATSCPTPFRSLIAGQYAFLQWCPSAAPIHPKEPPLRNPDRSRSFRPHQTGKQSCTRRAGPCNHRSLSIPARCMSSTAV